MIADRAHRSDHAASDAERLTEEALGRGVLRTSVA
jgi:hypothetical protein